MKKWIAGLGFSALLFSSMHGDLFAQAKLVETVEAKHGELLIPYKKFVLPNGLTLIVHEDHSDPIVHVDVTYHVGSAREELGKSGFAHFFEHMMFQGSDNVADEQHFKIITESGGTLNGTTNKDRTNYFETVPSNQLEKMLWLEADRMGFLLDAVTQEKFEIQRATVKNERGQRYDNRPYGLVGEVVAQNLYPYAHPYSWLTIGFIEDLNRVDVNDLKNFFLRWYGPNNAVLTVGGNVETNQVVKWVEKYFGSIPRGPEVENMELPVIQLSSNRYVTMTDNYAKLPMLHMVYPSTPFYHKDEFALDCLAYLVGQGKNSLLYKNLVKTNKAMGVSMYNATYELSGELSIRVSPFKGVQLSEVEQIIQNTLKEFEQKGVTDEDLNRFKAEQEARLIYGLESVSSKVSKLAAFATFTGNPNQVAEEQKKLAALTKEDVMRVYNQYVKGQGALVVSVLTKDGKEAPAADNNYMIAKRPVVTNDDQYKGLKYVKAKDNFDRSVIPPTGPIITVKPPAFERGATMVSGSAVKYIYSKSTEIPAVSLQLSFKGGKLSESISKLGLTSLFASMLQEDSKSTSSEVLDARLDELGSSIRIGSSNDAIIVSVNALTKNFAPTMDILRERLLEPAFNDDDFQRLKKRSIEGIKNAMAQPEAVASRVFSKLIYGADNLQGLPGSGTEQSLQNITLDDIKNYYAQKFSIDELELVVVGDIEKEPVINSLQFLSKMPKSPVTLTVQPLVEVKNNNKTVYFVDFPNAAQTEFRIGSNTGLKFDATGDYYRCGIMNYPLGGAFNSRVNLYLREEKGWTYGARARFSGDKYSGIFGFAAGILAKATDSALVDALAIIDKYRVDGIMPAELLFTKNSLGQSEALDYETGRQKASFLGRILRYNLPDDVSDRQTKILNDITALEATQLAKKYIPSLNDMVILLVGDKAKYAPLVEAKGFKVVELDREGNVIK